MITWMQRHRKYLVITIWISTIAFIGAGVVGWGQYDYSNKSGAVAKVGDIAITNEEFQRAYSNLFNQYNQVFGGKLDEKQAQQFGLPRQALKTLMDQALVLNLAQSYKIQITDEEVWNAIKANPDFSKGGGFDKETYENVLQTRYGLSKQKFDEILRKELLIQKTLYLFSPVPREQEINALGTALGVADKIKYQLLTPSMLSVSTDEAGLKKYWENHKNEFLKEASYDLSIIRTSASKNTAEDKTDKEALKLYIDFKKGTLEKSIPVEKLTISAAHSPFAPELVQEISRLTPQKPFLKPRKIGNDYLIIKLDAVHPSAPKSYEEAKTEANIAYTHEMKKTKLQELAQNSYKTFNGSVSDFIMQDESAKLSGLSKDESNEFIQKLFTSKQKQGFLTLKTGNVILYNVLEQKLLQNTEIANENAVMKLKGNLLHQKLLKMLESKYPIEIYVEGI